MEKEDAQTKPEPLTFIHARLHEDGDDGFAEQPGYDAKYNPAHDKRDMRRLGRKQQLKRRFKYLSIGSFIVVLGNTWTIVVITSVFSIANGGTAGAIWVNLIVCIGVIMTTISMAEVASMAPTSGGQYHWASEIAPRAIQKRISYASGWLATLGWQTATPAISYLLAQQIEALIAVVNPNYKAAGWHGALLTIGVALFAIAASVFIASGVVRAQKLANVVYCFGGIAFLAILWSLGPTASARETFLHFDDANHWGSYGIATLVGIIGPIATFIGGDAAVHMAEELQEASYILPRAMISGTVINCAIGLVALISFMFNLGEIDDSLYVYAEQPWVAVMLRITASRAATIVMILVVAVSLFFAIVDIVMASSRQFWAFARDKGVPFHGFFSQVGRDGIPRNAVAFTFGFTVVLALIIIGSSSAFNIILSFGTSGLYGSYIVVVSTIISRRFSKDHTFPPTKFSLGRYGLAVNIASLVYLLVAWSFTFCPPVPNPTPAEMNWASLMFGGVLVIAFIWYLLRARFEYDGPVQYVRKEFE